MTYDAFISHSHKDGDLASQLRKALQTLARPWLRRRALRVFVDKSDLAATGALPSSIRNAVDKSRHLILLASPEAAASHWVEEEVRSWLESHSASALLLVLTDGAVEWNDRTQVFERATTTALPAILFDAFAEEPRLENLTWVRVAGDQKYQRSATFLDTARTLAAAIHGKNKTDFLSAEQRTQLNERLRLWAAVVVFAVLSVGLFFAQQLAETRATEASKARSAERKARTQAEDEMTFMLTDLRDGLKQIGRLDLLRSVAERASAYYGSLPAVSRDADQSFRQTVALENACDVLAESGRLREALAGYKVSLAMRQQLHGELPESLLDSAIAGSHSKIANASDRASRWTDALEHCEAGLRLAKDSTRIAELRGIQGNVFVGRGQPKLALPHAKAAVEVIPFSTVATEEQLRARSTALYKLGQTYRLLHKHADALAAFSKQQETVRPLIERNSSDVNSRRSLAASYIGMGDSYRDSGKWILALKAYRAGIAEFDHLLKIDSTRVVWLNGAAVAHIALGQALAAIGRNRESVAHYREAQRVARRLTLIAPAGNYQETLVSASAYLGEALRRIGRLEEARDAHRVARDTATELVKRDPSNQSHKWRLYTSRIYVAGLASSQLDAAIYEAIKTVGNARELARQSGRLTWKRTIAGYCHVIARLCEAKKDWASALRHIDEAIKIERAALRERDVLRWRHDMSVYLALGAKYRKELGDETGRLNALRTIREERLTLYDEAPSSFFAVSLARAAIRLAKLLDRAEGTRLEAQALMAASIARLNRYKGSGPGDVEREMSACHEVLGDSHLRAGSVEQGLVQHSAALQLSLSLSRRFPDLLEYKRDSFVSLLQIARLCVSLHKPKEAERYLLRAVALSEQLLRKDPLRAQYLQDALAVRTDLADEYHKKKDLRASVAQLERAREVASLALMTKPDAPSIIRSIAITRLKLGISYMDLSEAASALVELREATSQHARLLKRDQRLPREHEIFVRKLRLAEHMAGVSVPTTPHEHLELAYQLLKLRRYSESVGAFKFALANDHVRNDLRRGNLYNAACAAALCYGDTKNESHQRRALGWLGIDLRLRKQKVASIKAGDPRRESARAELAAHIRHARHRDPDLATLRRSREFDALFE